MPTPRLILLARNDVQNRWNELQRFLSIVPLDLVFAACPEDVTEAKKITPQVGAFLKPVGLVADFPASLVINEDGTIEPLTLEQEQPVEAPLVQLVD